MYQLIKYFYSESNFMKLARNSNYIIPIFVLSLLTSCSNTKEIEQKAKKPFKNVIVIVGDDHASTVIGAYGNKLINTPHLDQLAAQGALFSHAYSNSPLCSASRQSLLTGKYPHATGVSLLFTPFNDKINITLAEHLQKHHFVTALIGKHHFNTWIWSSLYEQGYPQFGFDILINSSKYRNWLDKKVRKPIPEGVYNGKLPQTPKHIARMNPATQPQPYFDAEAKGTFLAHSAIEFINHHRQKRFLLWLAFHEPHAPFAFPIEYAGQYKAEAMPLPEGSPEDDRWIPKRFKGFTDEQKRGIIASYYTSVEFLDKNIGLVLEHLKKNNLYEETLIVYLSDQGYLLYDHKRFEKHTLWQEAIKVPLIVVGHQQFPKSKKYDELIELIDVAPFITDALGLPKMPQAQGKSFLPLLLGTTYTEKDYVFAEFLEDNKAMIANKKWKYIFATGKRDLGQGNETGFGAAGITHRLYDLENDPAETINLAYIQAHSTLVHDLKEVMLQHFLATHPYADELPDQLTLDGKLVWFCEPRDVGAEYGGKPLKTFYPSD